MVSPTPRVSGCGVESNLFDSVDFSMMDSEGLCMPLTASSLMDSRQFSCDTFSLAGDPYLEFDNVTRSFDPDSVADVVFKTIPMGPSDDALASWTGHEAAVDLGCNNKCLENLSHDAVAMSSIDDALAACMEHNATVNLDSNNMSLKSHAVPSSTRFQATDVPPGIPSNVGFQLQPMTYWLRGADAHVIANMMLDFLTAKATTTITKVNPAKFSIKVNICIDGSECVAKLRMYSNDASRAFALELQRRSGCCLVCSRFHKEVGSYLAAHRKSVQLELLNALEGVSSPAWTNADVGTDGMVEPAALMRLACSQSQTHRMEAEASLAMLQKVPQVAWAHEQGPFRGDQCLDAE